MRRSQVAVIVTSHNRGRTLKEALASASGQTLAPAELVVIDDGSTDIRTRQELAAAERAGHKVFFSERQGLTAVRNRGVRLTTAPYVVLLTANDLLIPTYLETATRHLEGRPHASFVACRRRPGVTTRNHEDPQAVVLADVLSTAGFHVSMFRREVWDALGGFDEELEHYSEADFWARAIESGFEGDVLAEPMFQGHRLPPDNGDGLSRLDSELRVMERFFRKHVAAGNTNDLVLAKERDLVDERRRFEQLCDRKGRLEDQLRSLQASIDQIAAELRLVGRGRVEFGDFRRASPISPLWGVDRGIPLDRYYIHRFLEQCRTDIRGRVLEIKDAGYTRWFGSDQVSRSDVLDINAANTNATILADLTKAPAIVDDTYDCFILTQTLGVVYDVGAAIAEAYRILKPEGVLLCTLPAVGRISCEEGLDGDYWRFTEASVRRLFAEIFPVDAFEVTGYGNVLACTAFLYGLAPDELTPAELDCVDPYFPVVYTVRAVKRADNRSANSSPVQS